LFARYLSKVKLIKAVLNEKEISYRKFDGLVKINVEIVPES